eukprot:2013678-Rhodomonas_salina.3
MPLLFVPISFSPCLSQTVPPLCARASAFPVTARESRSTIYHSYWFNSIFSFRHRPTTVSRVFHAMMPGTDAARAAARRSKAPYAATCQVACLNRATRVLCGVQHRRSI